MGITTITGCVVVGVWVCEPGVGVNVAWRVIEVVLSKNCVEPRIEAEEATALVAALLPVVLKLKRAGTRLLAAEVPIAGRVETI
jgi:hypothetical protein